MLVPHLQDQLGKDDVVCLLLCGVLVGVFEEFDQAETTVVVESIGVSSLVLHEDCADTKNLLESLGYDLQKWSVSVGEAGPVRAISPEDA